VGESLDERSREIWLHSPGESDFPVVTDWKLGVLHRKSSCPGASFLHVYLSEFFTYIIASVRQKQLVDFVAFKITPPISIANEPNKKVHFCCQFHVFLAEFQHT